MASLDYEYLAELVKIAQAGDSNAFAEIYAATYQKQYKYAYLYVGDIELAKQAIQATYVEALKNLSSLQNTELFVPWLNRISFKICYELSNSETQHLEEVELKIGSMLYHMNQIMKLPLTESQVIIQYYYQALSLKEIADNLEISKDSAKRYLRSGRNHLLKLTGNAN